MSDFDRALQITLKEEGGWSPPRASDPNPTMRGITQATYNRYREQHGLPIQLIGDAELHAIYLTGYWNACRCDDLAWPLCAAVFDFSVNSGPHAAVAELQGLAGFTGHDRDGAMGPKTLAALAVFEQDAASLVDLTKHYLAARLAYDWSGAFGSSGYALPVMPAGRLRRGGAGWEVEP